jgi:hypothetical protein
VEGVYFYWCSWVCWIFATFFMKKTKKRTVLAASVLITIILSAYNVTIGLFSVTFSFLFILFFAYYFVAKKTGWKLVYMFMATITVTLAYVSFHLLALVDPVWVWMDETWMLAMILMFVCLMFYHDVVSRLLSVIIGSCQGDILYAFVLKRFSFPYVIGSFSFLDALMISCTCIFVWSLLEQLPLYVDTMQKQIKRIKQS